MYRVFFFLIGFGLMVVGFTYIITYMNLMTMGYSFINYLEFILGRIECFFSLIGFMIVSIVIFTSGRRLNDLYIWYFT